MFAARSIALIGATESEGSVGRSLLTNLLSERFDGVLYPINPRRESVLGVKCHPDLASLPETPDLAIIVTPAATVPGVVRECGAKGVGVAIIISAGFKETGEEGEKLERKTLAAAREARVRLLGPNCLGFVNLHRNLNASFAPAWPPAGSISVISQSGALCVGILDWAASARLGISKIVSFGNKADLNEVDLITSLARDPETKVIAAYLESISEGDAFMEVAEETAKIKPVVVLKVGVTQAGAKAASSHTGSLAGADMAYWAAFRRSGVIRAENYEALFDYALAFATQPLPAGRRLAVITNAGGPGIMAADAAELSGLTMTSVTPETKEQLLAALPAAASAENPIDVLGDAGPDRYILSLELAQRDPNVDAVLMVVTPQNMTRPLELAHRIKAAHDGAKPLFCAFMGGTEVAEAREFLMDNSIPSYPAPDRAIAALRAMHDYAAWRERPPRIVTRFAVNRRRVDRIMQWHTLEGVDQVAEVEAKQILRAYGFNVLPGQIASTADEAVDAANRFGYPVVLKISSPDIIHKSDFGGVRVNLANAEQVRDSFELMMLRIKRRFPEARIRGGFIEKMGSRGHEVILGMSRDPQFGPMLMFGLGGIFVEVMKDVTFYLAPITKDEALQMLKGTRSYDLLKGVRGQAPVDIDAIATAIQRISQLVTDYPQISELDINPFIVGELGSEPYVADARMSLSPPSQP